MADSCPRSALALRELESLASLWAAGLFALDRASISRQETKIAKLAAMCLIEGDERTGNREAQGARLSRLPTSIDVRPHPTARRQRRAPHRRIGQGCPWP
jgi:hypothetical protein